MLHLKDSCFTILNAALSAVKPEELFRNNLHIEGNKLSIFNHFIDIGDYKHIYVIGMGKASAHMALEIEKLLFDHISEGAIVTKYGHAVPCKKIKVFEAGHPVVDKNSIKYSSILIDIAAKASEDDLVICLISGGGSALFEMLPSGISLEDLQIITSRLLNSGADINELNTVRKKLSLVKGGRLADIIYPAASINLIISDVIDDRLEMISSGLTIKDTSSFKDACEIIHKYDLQNKIPVSIYKYLLNETEEKIINDQYFTRVNNFILGNNITALSAAKLAAEELGFNAEIITTRLSGSVEEAGKYISSQIEMKRNNSSGKCCLLFGGETTVKVKGTGSGGRNQELALYMLNHLSGSDFQYFFASCGTDGTDGNTNAAGGIASQEVLFKSQRLGLNIKQYLDNNDSYSFLKAADGLITTGPTGTNVMDVAIAVID